MIHGVTVGSGPTQVVFLHGLSGQGKNFTRIATSLAGVVICHLLDLPNHGASSRAVGFTLNGQSEHIARWLWENFGGPVALVGHSLGEELTMRSALTHPGLVDRLLVADVSLVPGDGPTGFTLLVAAIRSLNLEHLASRTEASRRLASAIPNLQVRGFLLQSLRRLGGDWAWKANLDLFSDSLWIIGGWLRMDAVYDGPVWWVAGGQSPHALPERAGPMRRLPPRVVTIALKRADHRMHTDESEAFMPACTEFLTLPIAASSARLS